MDNSPVQGLLDGGTAKLFAAIFNVTSRATDALSQSDIDAANQSNLSPSVPRFDAIKIRLGPQQKRQSRQQTCALRGSLRNLRRAQQQEESGGHHGLI
jgi:hypothetical protein